MKIIFLITILLSPILSQNPPSTPKPPTLPSEKEPVCNKEILQMLQLDGVAPKGIRVPIATCPSIKREDMCCSSIDAIKMYKHWLYSQENAKKFRTQIQETYQDLLKFE